MVVLKDLEKKKKLEQDDHHPNCFCGQYHSSCKRLRVLTSEPPTSSIGHLEDLHHFHLGYSQNADIDKDDPKYIT